MFFLANNKVPNKTNCLLIQVNGNMLLLIVTPSRAVRHLHITRWAVQPLGHTRNNPLKHD